MAEPALLRNQIEHAGKRFRVAMRAACHAFEDMALELRIADKPESVKESWRAVQKFKRVCER